MKKQQRVIVKSNKISYTNTSKEPTVINTSSSGKKIVQKRGGGGCCGK